MAAVYTTQMDSTVGWCSML